MCFQQWKGVCVEEGFPSHNAREELSLAPGRDLTMGAVLSLFPIPGLKMTGVECVEGMASGLYQELFAAVVSLINR